MNQSDLAQALPPSEQFFHKYINRHVEKLISVSTQLSDNYLQHREKVILKQKATNHLQPGITKKLNFLRVIEASFKSDDPNETIEGMSKIQIRERRMEYEQLIAEYAFIQGETEEEMTLDESADSSLTFEGKQVDTKRSTRWDLYTLRGLEGIGVLLSVLLLTYQLLK